MTKIYFAGQDNFGNRGCEALVRSNIKTLKKRIPHSTFLVPSRCIGRDSAQWLSASEHGVEFIRAEPIPSSIRWWSRGRRVLSALDAFPPAYRVSEVTRRAISSSDAVVMTGGDIISLDYGLESLYYWTRLCETAVEMGVPTVLWGASVGPFEASESAPKRMRAFLKRFSLITVRETESLKYLNALGVEGVELVSDSAFALDTEAPPADVLRFFNDGGSVLGFNVSPLIRKFRSGRDQANALDVEVAEFLMDVLKAGDYKVLLIPHVDPLDGSAENSDSTYMAGILRRVHASGYSEDQIDMLPRTLNAAQLKAVVGRCEFFMGARTHATIAALSQGVPTTSIAYSVKAKGINQDIFGHTRYVLDTPSVSRRSLMEHFEMLKTEGSEIAAILSDRLPVWKRNAARSADLLHGLLLRGRSAAA